MLIGSLISFGIMVLAWMILPVKETEVASTDLRIEPVVASREPARG